MEIYRGILNYMSMLKVSIQDTWGIGERRNSIGGGMGNAFRYQNLL